MGLSTRAFAGRPECVLPVMLCQGDVEVVKRYESCEHCTIDLTEAADDLTVILLRPPLQPIRLRAATSVDLEEGHDVRCNGDRPGVEPLALFEYLILEPMVVGDSILIHCHAFPHHE